MRRGQKRKKPRRRVATLGLTTGCRGSGFLPASRTARPQRSLSGPVPSLPGARWRRIRGPGASAGRQRPLPPAAPFRGALFARISRKFARPGPSPVPAEGRCPGQPRPQAAAPVQKPRSSGDARKPPNHPLRFFSSFLNLILFFTPHGSLHAVDDNAVVRFWMRGAF